MNALICGFSFCLAAHCISYTCSLSFLDFFPIYVATELQVEFPVLYSRQSLIIDFIHSNLYMSIPLSQFIPLST